jgi:hypothetical protein
MIVKPKHFLIALGLTIVTLGSSHLLVAYAQMFTNDYNEGNLFRILNFHKVFPGIDTGWTNFIISNVIAVSMYLVVLNIIMRHDKKR